MRRKPGDSVGPLRLRSIEGALFDLDVLRGTRVLLAFFRFAACPFCNLRVHELVSRFDELGGRLTVVAIFDSPLDNLRHQADRHRAPFPILADETNAYYRAFAIERSIVGMFKAAFLRFPSVLRAMLLKGFLPSSFQGRLTTLPAEFLVDEQGVIREAYYGKDIGDHLPFEQVKAFALGEAR
ncbi:MAG: AhpC/TSA family protein [Gammaproteobacteria bacterium]|nr:AhpC/TSA family protein [Gammaproteobacteria bacterium]